MSYLAKLKRLEQTDGHPASPTTDPPKAGSSPSKSALMFWTPVFGSASIRILNPMMMSP
jgi:hypothetical protein